MTDFNLEQFKAGRIAVDKHKNEYRFLAEINNMFYNLVVVRLGQGDELPFVCSYSGKINDDVSLKMKPEKKKLYIAITKEPREGEEYHMSTDAFYTMKGVSDKVKHIVDDSFVHQEAKKFQDVKIVEVEIEV